MIIWMHTSLHVFPSLKWKDKQNIKFNSFQKWKESTFPSKNARCSYCMSSPVFTVFENTEHPQHKYLLLEQLEEMPLPAGASASTLPECEGHYSSTHIKLLLSFSLLCCLLFSILNRKQLMAVSKPPRQRGVNTDTLIPHSSLFLPLSPSRMIECK